MISTFGVWGNAISVLCVTLCVKVHFDFDLQRLTMIWASGKSAIHYLL